VSLVLNVEEGAELAISAGDERNETVHEAVQPMEGAPDLCMESHFEYGARVGYWRICEMADALGMPLTLNACARALEAMPWVGRDAARRGYEIQCHGYRWEPHAGMGEGQERELIARCVAIVERVYGKRPIGWHTNLRTVRWMWTGRAPQGRSVKSTVTLSRCTSEVGERRVVTNVCRPWVVILQNTARLRAPPSLTKSADEPGNFDENSIPLRGRPDDKN
jgi:peptidoglycan/xylan/chitin deacetylase (PgdA/CDA1 family)